MALYVEDPLNGEGLVWSSEVQIEIDPGSRDSVSLSRFPNPSDGRSMMDTTSPPRRHRNVGTPFSDGDADDEWSLCPPSSLLPDVGGRPRSRTKQFRRRGIDLSRDELRISSRWDNAEKQSMENFRSAIKEKATTDSPDGLFKLWNGRSGTSRSKDTKNLKTIVKDLRSSVSRGRRKLPAQIAAVGTSPAKSIEVGLGDESPRSSPTRLPLPVSQQQRPTLRRVRSSLSLCRSKSAGRAYTLQVPIPDFGGIGDGSLEKTVLNWQEHLEQDLQQPVVKRSDKKGRYLPQDGADSAKPSLCFQDRAVLPSDYFPDHSIAIQQSSKGLSRLRPSATMSELSDLQVESYWRLPSLAVSASYSNNLGSREFSTEHVQPQKSSNIISSREFDSAWWKDTATTRNMSSNSSQPVTTIASRSTSTFSGITNADTEHAYLAKTSIAEMVAALKLKLAADIDGYEATTVRPLLQPSVNLSSHEKNLRHQQSSQLLSPVLAGKGLASSTSLPNTIITFQDHNLERNSTDEGDGYGLTMDNQARWNWLALH